MDSGHGALTKCMPDGTSPKQSYSAYIRWGYSHRLAVMGVLMRHSASVKEFQKRAARFARAINPKWRVANGLKKEGYLQ